MVNWARNDCFEALVPVETFVEDCVVGVKHIQDGISVHFLTRRVNADLEVRQGTLDQFLQKGPFEDPNFDQTVLVVVTERRHEIWLRSRTVDLVDFNVYHCRSMDQSLVHVK